MYKVSHFLNKNKYGPSVIPLFGKADAEFEKVASSDLLPDVVHYIDALRPNNASQYVLVNAMGAGEFYGCFTAGTLITTSEGEKPIEKVQAGELVLTHKNRYRKVRATTSRQTEELCDLYVQGLPTNLPALSPTPNHELWAVTREDFLTTKRRVVWKGDTSISLDERREEALRQMEFSWVPVSSLRPGDYIAEPFPLEEDPAALGDEKWNVPAVAFLMGLYAAEGCTVNRAERPGSDHYVVFVTSNAEKKMLDRARNAATQFGHNIYVDESPETHSARLELHWQDFARLCRKHVEKLGPNKKLSISLLRMPREWQRVFFHAYSEGDGCVRGEGKEEGTIRCVSASASLLLGIRLLLARQGFAASISGRHNKKATWYSGNPMYELQVSSGQLRGRGTPKSYLHPDGFILSAVKRVKQYAWLGNVYDLEVEEDFSYTASGVAVHNSNINGDHFPEASLIHMPDNWTGTPAIDKIVSRKWAYGFPTFYNAYPYAHHRNKDPSRAFGEVELATWNPNMRRVELVVRVDHDKCLQFGGTGVWDRLRIGGYPDVSMGTKVPFDTCSICLDWFLYRKAMATFDPQKHLHPGQAILGFHKRKKERDGVGIRGLSVTRQDYCEHAKREMSRIYEDGRKVWVYNDFPRFFDISFVFIGADKTAKVMLFIFRNGKVYSTKPSVEVAHELGAEEPDDNMQKAASVDDVLLKAAFGKLAKPKRATIEKDVVPSQFAGEAVPLLTRKEPSLSNELLDELSCLPLKNTLSTTAGMGIVLRPREFQRIIIIQLGHRPLADELDQKDIVFSRSDREEPMEMGQEHFLPALSKLLLPLLATRSALGPVIEKRIVVSQGQPEKVKIASSHTLDLLDKIGAAYNGYRRGVMELVAHSQQLMDAYPTDDELSKMASVPVTDIFTPLAVAYLKNAFMDEFGVLGQRMVKLAIDTGRRVEGPPLEEHVAN